MFPQFPWAGLVVIYKYTTLYYKNQIYIFIRKCNMKDNTNLWLAWITYYNSCWQLPFILWHKNHVKNGKS